MKVLVCDPIAPEAMEKLKKGKGITEVVEKTGMTPEQLAEVIEPYHAVIVRSATKVKAPAIQAGKNLKVIARGGIGLDNIDVEAAKKAGVKVVNTPGASTMSVAELALAHMFAAARNLAWADATTKAGKWEKKKLKGVELNHKTLGVIGFGRIGQGLARACKFGLNMKIVFFDLVQPAADVVRELGAESVTLDELMRLSDYVSLHLPLTPQTKNLLDKKQFEMAKKGMIIVNCARGGVVNEPAILEALKSGKVAYYATDVFETEPAVADNPLLQLPNVSTTPHIGAETKEGQFRVGLEVAEKVIEALNS